MHCTVDRHTDTNFHKRRRMHVLLLCTQNESSGAGAGVVPSINGGSTAQHPATSNQQPASSCGCYARMFIFTSHSCCTRSFDGNKLCLCIHIHLFSSSCFHLILISVHQFLYGIYAATRNIHSDFVMQMPQQRLYAHTFALRLPYTEEARVSSSLIASHFSNRKFSALLLWWNVIHPFGISAFVLCALFDQWHHLCCLSLWLAGISFCQRSCTCEDLWRWRKIQKKKT